MVLLALIILFPLGGTASAMPGVCACAAQDNAWCDVHEIGYLGGIEIHSERLFSVLDAHGHELDLDTFDCAECKAAISADGFCEEHRVGFVDGREDAPVDADLSLVNAPATAPADGVSLVRLEVTPCDGSGIPLGEGVILRLDPASLGPAETVGGFTHQGDGSFVIKLKSAGIGDAMLLVEADGVTLSQAPVVSFVAP